jgi:hypothetical protein
VQAIAFDAAVGAIGVGIASYATTAYQLARAGTPGTIGYARYLQGIGEGAIGAGERTGIQLGGRTLFPDVVSSSGLQEAKNVAIISARDTRQISSYADYSKQFGLDPVQLFTRPNTNVSAIQNLLEEGAVVQRLLPGVNNLGVLSLTQGEAATVGGIAGAAKNIFSAK